jgi:DNA-binding transcriptional LysR family regulator
MSGVAFVMGLMVIAVGPGVQYRFGPLPYLAGIAMELRHLRYFLAVAREASFSRAAEQLHIAQPPLSRQIHQLEEELGAALFDRTSRPLRLTPAGQFFQAQAQLVMDRLAEARTATARIAHGQRRWFGIGFVPSTLYGALPEVIRRFREAQPEVEVGLLELTTVQQIDALKAGRIDVGFGRLRFEEDERIDAEIVREEALCVALPADHRLARRKRLSLQELAGEPLLLFPARPRPSFADQVLAAFQARELRPTIAFEANELQTAIGLVVAHMGYTLVPRSVQKLHREGVLYLPLADKGVHSQVVMNTRAGDGSPLLAQVKELVREVVRRYVDEMEQGRHGNGG